MPVSKHKKIKNKMNSFGLRKIKRREDELKKQIALFQQNRELNSESEYDYGLQGSLATLMMFRYLARRAGKKYA